MPDDWPGHPQRKDYPLGRHPGRVQGRRRSRRRTSGGRTTDDHHRPTTRTPPPRRDDQRGHASSPSPARTGTPSSPGIGRRGRGADRRQHGPAAPVDPRRAPADPRARGRDGHRGPLRHRLPAHRHREEHGVPHLVAGRHVLHPDGLPRAVLQRGAYCLGVEQLLGIEDDIPEQAQVIRVLLMELNRISSHLVCIATGGMEIGALTVMTIGFRERELVLDLFELITGLRMNHAYIRPGGVAQDLPPGALDQIRDFITLMKKRLPEYADLCNANPIFKARLVGRRLPRPRRLHGARHHRPGAARDRLRRGTCARPSRTAATRTTTSTCRPGTPATPTAASGSGSTRCRSRCKIVEQCVDRLAGLEGAPVMVGRQEDRLAEPARPRQRRHGQHPRPHPHIMGESMEALIHHFKLVTEGFRVPAGQAYVAGRVAARRARRATSSPTAAPGRTACTSATRPSPTCRPRRRCARAAWSPTSSSPIASHRPGDGRSRPMMPTSDRTDEPSTTAPRRATTRAARDRRPLPAGRARRCCRCCTSCRRRRATSRPRASRPAPRSSASPPPRSSAVATFYTMYKRRPVGDYHVGVCTNTLCAVMGGDLIFERLKDHLDVGNDETTEDGKVTLEHIECNAACDYARW